MSIAKIKQMNINEIVEMVGIYENALAEDLTL